MFMNIKDKENILKASERENRLPRKDKKVQKSGFLTMDAKRQQNILCERRTFCLKFPIQPNFHSNETAENKCSQA